MRRARHERPFPKMSIAVSELGAGDGLIWRDLRLQALLESPDAFGATHDAHSTRPDAEWHRMIDATAADPNAASLVATLDGAPAGMAYCRMNSPGVGGLYAMWVSPGSRSRGIGRALVDFALAWMIERGAKYAELTVSEGNDPALALYVASGFVDTGHREPLRDGSDVQVVQMRRDLDVD